MDTPLKISVIMPVWNGERFLSQAISSILNQTFQDFELIIIDDGSTDKSLEIVHTFVDPRIKIIQNQTNTGLVAVRNQGIKACVAPFIAFLDCDDVSYPTRLEKQLSFLENHPDFGLVGTGVSLIDETGKKTGVKWQENIPAEQIPIRLLFGNCFTQSSIMIRRDALPQPVYREGFAPAEDYDLWVRILEKWKGVNLSEILVEYRQHTGNISQDKRNVQQSAVNQIISAQLAKLGIVPTEDELSIHRTNYVYSGENLKEFLEKREVWLQKILVVNQTSNIFDQNILKKVLSERWLTSCYNNIRKNISTWNIFWQSDLSKNLDVENYFSLFKFFIKSIIR